MTRNFHVHSYRDPRNPGSNLPFLAPFLYQSGQSSSHLSWYGSDSLSMRLTWLSSSCSVKKGSRGRMK
ncbi:hypothetical protein DUNSADRAFT_15672 [Dunaliella salina]|uniref:Encoded protein n=1 Tax=Dunaliella salina TaxID=3046 RepID=A0ABZ3KKH5_DUNSA|nr:hypothetical protein DUNSADRAFT_15672 [Dunaliella salina]|eukprot:KAF5829673.1 hypothetical protein DUNSADRAFT_15672 [Dunaliella salina]